MERRKCRQADGRRRGAPGGRVGTAGVQAGRQVGGQAGRQAGGQADRERHRQTEAVDEVGQQKAV